MNVGCPRQSFLNITSVQFGPRLTKWLRLPKRTRKRSANEVDDVTDSPAKKTRQTPVKTRPEVCFDDFYFLQFCHSKIAIFISDAINTTTQH